MARLRPGGLDVQTVRRVMKASEIRPGNHGKLSPFIRIPTPPNDFRVIHSMALDLDMVNSISR
jgi:hypothetical protein